MNTPEQDSDSGGDPNEGGHGRWMMIACCVPMIAVAVALVALGVVGAGFLLVAIGCLLMMALMMSAMSGR